MKKQNAASLFGKIAVGALVVNAAWYLLAVILRMPVLPDPLTVYAHIPEVLGDGMGIHLLASFRRIILGLAIAMVMALIVALGIFRWHKLGAVADAVVYFAYPVPKLALLPIVMLLAGLGDSAKVTMIVLIILFQLIVQIRDGLRRIPKEKFLTLTSLGASMPQMLYHLLLPSIIPDLLSGLRIAIGTAISVLFVTETYGTDKGMGYYIVDAWMRVDYLDMYSGIVLLSLLGFSLFFLSDLIEKRFTPWRD